MKKTVCCLLAFLMMLGMCACSNQGPLTQEQIAKLREQYPTRSMEGTDIGAIAVYYSFSMEQISRDRAEDWVRVKCIKEDTKIILNDESGTETDDSMIAAIEAKTGSSLTRTIVTHRYIMKVNDSCYGAFKKGDTFTLVIPETDLEFTPDPSKGGEYMMAVYHPAHPFFAQDPNVYESIFDFMFYITPNGYVLSVSDYENKEEYSGITVDEWIEKVKALKTE